MVFSSSFFLFSSELNIGKGIRDTQIVLHILQDCDVYIKVTIAFFYMSSFFHHIFTPRKGAYRTRTGSYTTFLYASVHDHMWGKNQVVFALCVISYNSSINGCKVQYIVQKKASFVHSFYHFFSLFSFCFFLLVGHFTVPDKNDLLPKLHSIQFGRKKRATLPRHR